MGLRPLGPRWIRRLERITGLQVVHASGNGGYAFLFTTDDHQHGWYDMKTGEWDIDPEARHHFSSCRVLFPQAIDSPPPPGGD
jgi:hypothetical protein